MLPDDVRKTLERRVGVAMRARREEPGIAAVEIDSQFIKAGQLGGSRHALYVCDAYGKELLKRGEVIFDTFKEVAVAHGLKMSGSEVESVANVLVDFLREQEWGLDQELRARNIFKGTGRVREEVTDALPRALDQARSKLHSDVELFAAESQRSASPVGGGISVVFTNSTITNSPVAIGHGSTVTGQWQIDTAAKDALLKALKLLEHDINGSNEIAPDEKKSVTALIAQSRDEIVRPKQRPATLLWLLGGLAAAIQTISATPAAIDAVKAALKLVGFHL